MGFELLFAAVALVGYVIGYFTGRRCAQQMIKDMRQKAGLNVETGEEDV